MKKNLLLPILLMLVGSLSGFQVNAQAPCTVDSQYTAPGIFPSDTLPDMTVGTAVSDVVQFVFPSDTVIFGFQLDFDSFVVKELLFEPAWLSWDCDQNQNNCTYYTTPPALTRGCVAVTGTPTMANPLWPAWDSVIVVGEGWVTVPFIGAQAATDSIAVYYRVEDPTMSLEDPLISNLNLTVAPNPTDAVSNISFDLIGYADFKVRVLDLQGREVAVLGEEKEAIGHYDYRFDASAHPAGVYQVRVELDGGQFVKTKKVLSVR